MEISADKLLFLLGSKEAEIYVLKERIAVLEGELKTIVEAKRSQKMEAG